MHQLLESKTNKCCNEQGQLTHSFFRDQETLKLQFQTIRKNVLQVEKRQKKHFIKR